MKNARLGMFLVLATFAVLLARVPASYAEVSGCCKCCLDAGCSTFECSTQGNEIACNNNCTLTHTFFDGQSCTGLAACNTPVPGSPSPTTTPTRTPVTPGAPTFTPTTTPTRTPVTPGGPLETDAGDLACSDTIDNDADNLIDCFDPDCNAVAPCLNRAPAVSSPAMIVLLLTLGVSGLLLAERQRRRSNN
jgi:hypothetical protein